ncbi:hypothetical protein [Asticcacaulis machinosus]|uniref:Uncharacterized protein n=1 Tax=Asticcacaulis machinosus TaxID=2984211 RepID=A0ABT5HGX3_9CAUL|nr:hypothetical protein [Asticcacaulis machinosus]MDC7675509.1 hypothetical protein [Asticcacaulis machinosus]
MIQHTVPVIKINSGLFQGEARHSDPHGVVSMFVKSSDPSYGSERFAVTVRHELDPEIEEVNVEVGGKLLRFGDIDDGIVKKAIAETRNKSNASVLRDVSVIKIADNVLCSNSVGNTLVNGVTSAAEHYVTGNAGVKIGDKYIGDVSTLFWNTPVSINSHETVELEVFGVKPSEQVLTDIGRIPAGSLATTPEGQALGIYVGFNGEMLFIDAKNVSSVLGMELMQDQIPVPS